MKLRVGLVGLGKAWEVRIDQRYERWRISFVVRAVCEEVGLRAERVARSSERWPWTAIGAGRAIGCRCHFDAVAPVVWAVADSGGLRCW